MRKIIYLIICFFISASWSQKQIPGQDQTKTILLHNAKIITGTGSIIEDGFFGFSNGKIDHISISKPQKVYDLEIDLKGKHIYPGFIALNSTLGLVEISAVRASDDEREMGTYNPNIRSIIAYNAESRIVETMRLNGVLIGQITPRGGVISGSSSVVQFDAWNWEDATIKYDEGMHVNWPNPYRRPSRWSSGSRTVTSSEKYLDQVNDLKNIFNKANSYNSNFSEKLDLKLESMKNLFNGTQTLYLHAKDQRQIVDGVSFFKSLGINKIVVIGGDEALQITEFLKKNNVSVIASHPHRLPSNEDSDVKEAFKLANILVSNGINMSIDVRGGMERPNTRNLPFFAGSFVGNGLDYNSAIQSLTINPARILGIEKDYGSLEVGKSATFFVSKGDALDMKTNILHHAFVDGRELELSNHQTKLRDKYLEKVSRNN
ncbi:MAG: amidohydrolase [Flavobacteriaceae bacterium]|nr:amidohydrolase [Flavobacteriaceae bacterium]|tara:strand:- start:5150 stop:6445 length:1296 start_codon:yes stop_codon:yes gene_type:complete